LRSHSEEELERELTFLNEHLVDGLYLPICGATDSHHCIVRLVPHEATPLHSKSRVLAVLSASAGRTAHKIFFSLVQVPYLFYYEIIESGEKCSAPNLHNFNLESARLSAGVPGVLSPFEEPNNVADSAALSNGRRNTPPNHTRNGPMSLLTPTKRIKEASIANKIGYYSEKNIASLQENKGSGEEGRGRSDQLVMELDQQNSENENGGKELSEEKEDMRRTESDVVMLEKLYQINPSKNDPEEDAQEPDALQPAEATTAPATANGKEDQPEITLASIFGESWNQKEERIRKGSPYSHLPNWSKCCPTTRPMLTLTVSSSRDRTGFSDCEEWGRSAPGAIGIFI